MEILDAYRRAVALRGLPPGDLPPGVHGERVEAARRRRELEVDPALFGAPGEERVYFAAVLSLTLEGVCDYQAQLRRLGRPMGLYGYNGLMRHVLYEYALSADEGVVVESLDRMDAFLAHCAAYPVVPPALVDCKNCALCLMETEHSLQHRATRLLGKTCCHVFDNHPEFVSRERFCEADFLPRVDAAPPPRAVSRPPRDEDAVGGGPILALDPRSDVLLAGTSSLADCTRAPPAGGGGGRSCDTFTDLAAMLRDVRRDNDMKKKRLLLRQNLARLNVAHADCGDVRAPKCLAFYAPVFLRGFRLGVHLRRERVAELSRGPAPPAAGVADVDRLQRKVAGSLDRHGRTGVLALFYAACLPFNYKYFRTYRLQAARVLWFKHMEALGYTCEDLAAFVGYLQSTPLAHWVGVQHDRAPSPSGVDPRLCLLFWACVNVYAFSNVWPHAVVRHADDPALGPGTEGVFLSHAHVGFSHAAGDERRASVGSLGDLFSTLARYDVLLTKL